MQSTRCTCYKNEYLSDLNPWRHSHMPACNRHWFSFSGVFNSLDKSGESEKRQMRGISTTTTLRQIRDSAVVIPFSLTLKQHESSERILKC